MPNYISYIVLPDGTQYDIKDSYGRYNANAAYNTAVDANNTAHQALELGTYAVPEYEYITTEEINQIWEAN